MKRFHPKWESGTYKYGCWRLGFDCAEAPGNILLLANESGMWAVEWGEGWLASGDASSLRGAKTAATRAYNRLVKEGVIKVEEEA